MEQESPKPTHSNLDYKLAFEASHRYASLMMELLERNESSGWRAWWIAVVGGTAIGWGIRSLTENDHGLQGYFALTIFLLLCLLIINDMWQLRKPIVRKVSIPPKEL